VNYMDLKIEKKRSSRAIEFWQGVIKTLTFANQVGTFSKLTYFEGFTSFAIKNLKTEEKVFHSTLAQQQEMK